MSAKGPAVLAAGLLILGAAAGELSRGSPVVQAFFYLFAWSATLLLLAGLQELLLGGSFAAEPGRFVRLAGFSIPWWLAFEAVNFRLDNWAYEGLPPTRWIRWGGYAVAFATVLPAVLELEKVLGRASRRVAPRPWLVSESGLRLQTFLGLAFLALPLAFPGWAYPLTWGFVFLLVEPWLVRNAPERSWLKRLAEGDGGRPARLLFAGVLCGFWWELLNVWAGAKWRYTVPWPQGPKAFEMPWAGYLGFPPFALECASGWAFFDVLWSRSGATARAVLVAALAAFSLWTFAGIDEATVRSFAAWP